MAAKLPPLKVGDWKGVRRALQSLSHQLDNPTFESVDTNSMRINLPDGLAYIKDKEVQSAPFDDILGNFMVT